MSKKTNIPSAPSSQDGEIVSAVMRKLMGDELLSLAEELGVDIEEMARFTPLAETLRTRRKEQRMSIKTVAAEFGVHKRIIDAIELCNLEEIDGALLATYAMLLGREGYFLEWVKENQSLAYKLGIPGVEKPTTFNVPDANPNAPAPRLLAPGESLGASETKAKVDALLQKFAGLLDAEIDRLLDEPSPKAKKK